MAYFGVVGKISILAAVAALSACTGAPQATSSVEDPYEDGNRAIHEFNKSVDRNVVRPVSNAYGDTVPRPVRRGVNNVASNLGEPVAFINHTLQGDFDDAASTFFRFAMNTIFGLGGTLDIASEAGIFERETDFGETMAVWGIGPGAYLEVPLWGPSTQRDLAGAVINIGINPTTYLLSGTERALLTGGQVAEVIDERYEFRSVVDALLYESADSYSAAKIAYLQNRAQEIINGLNEEDLEDPYAFE